MYEQRIEEKRHELEDAHVAQRTARKALRDAESGIDVPETALPQLRAELARAEENVFWVNAELDALNELQVEHLATLRVM
ncbi:hypothetical protein [Roseateles sp. BYS96W]|uniref:ABC transporter Uup C-terminal domain-containing protein n=1 Tax=Pelomonas nitida TaxID=3299027 RepID=A0ABW7G3S0_9BURK